MMPPVAQPKEKKNRMRPLEVQLFTPRDPIPHKINTLENSTRYVLMNPAKLLIRKKQGAK